MLGTHPYTRGLTDFGSGCWAWLQPDGGWGWSNAGLVTDGDEALLVDTLFDTALTGSMLDAMRAASPAAGNITTLVNTHSNGDHCNGNCLLPASTEIVASRATAEEMPNESPAMMAGLLENADGLGETGAFFRHCFGAFAFAGIEQRLPDSTFEGAAVRQVGDKRVELTEVGPAHTHGDVIVHVPADRTVFTGDILFIEGHPILWAGPVANWVAACDHIIGLDPEVVVPGHGPVTDTRGVRAVRDYLTYITGEARQRFDAGMAPLEAARDINLGDYDSWGDAERIAINVACLYREFGATDTPADPLTLFGWMAQLHRERRR